MPKDLLKTTEKVLHSHKLPSYSLEKVHDHVRTAKKDLDKILGLDISNMYRMVIPLDRPEQGLMKDYPKTYSVVAHLLHQAHQGGQQLDLSTLSLVKNEIIAKGQAGKATKIIAKQLEGQESIIDHCAAELGIKGPAQFLPKLGDIIKSGRKLVISSNILDFLTGSNNCAYTSCHKVGGGHYNGNISYACDDFSLVSFIIDAKDNPLNHELYKHGRAWMQVQGTTVVQAKSYGSFFEFEREMARNAVIDKLVEHYGVAKEFSTHFASSLPNESISFATPKDNNGNSKIGWFDNYGLDISFHGAKYTPPKLVFSPALCLECGTTTDMQDKGACRKHYGKHNVTCDKCGTRHPVDKVVNVEGINYCPTCTAELLAHCGHCGEYQIKGSEVKVDGADYCPACVKAYAVVCGDCGELTRKDRTANIKLNGEAVAVCRKCEKKYALCPMCGQHHPIDEIVRHTFVGRACRKCLAANTFTCHTCGEVHPNKNKVVSGDLECLNCEATRLGIAPPIKSRPEGLPEGWDDFIEEVG